MEQWALCLSFVITCYVHDVDPRWRVKLPSTFRLLSLADVPITSREHKSTVHVTYVLLGMSV